MLDFLSDSNTLKFLIPLLGAVVAWYVNENRKRAWEEYERKEENYKELIKALKGFYAQSHNPEEQKKLKNQFIDQLNLCWLYSPDDVIQLGYSFIESVMTGRKSTDEQKERALGDFMLAIRKDLLHRRISRKTTLQAADFKNLTST